MGTLKKVRTIISLALMPWFGFMHVLIAQNMNQHFLNYTDFEGLPDNHINCFVKDQQGYLWIGTTHGLSKFDGKHFQNFYFVPNDSNSISGNNIETLYCDSKNNLWVATQGAGISKINLKTDKITRFNHQENDSTSLACNTVKGFMEDGTGTIWMAVFGFGLDSYDEKQNSFKHHSLVQNIKTTYHPNEVLTIKKNSAGNFWLTTRNGIVFFNPISKQYKVHYAVVKDSTTFLSTNLFFNSYLESDSCIWVSSAWLGLLKFNPLTNVFEAAEAHKIFYQNMVVCMVEKNKNELWVATSDNGLGIFNKSTKSFTFFTKKNYNRLAVIDTINATTILKSGENIFVGFNKGVSVLSPASDIINYITLEKEGFDISLISDIAYCPTSGKYFFGCAYSYGIFVYEQGSGITKQILLPFFEGKLPVYQFKEIAPGSDMYLVTTSKGLYVFDAHKEVFLEPPFLKTVNKKIGYAFIQASTVDVNHTIWVGGKQFLLALDFNKNIFSDYSDLKTNNTTDTSFSIHNLYADRKQNIWATTSKAHILIKEHNSAVFHRLLSDNKPVVSVSRIDNILQDMQGNYWLGTSGSGIMKLSAKDFSTTYIFSKSANIGNDVYGMELDQNGKLWTVTNTGVFVFNTLTNAAIHYSEKNGFIKSGESFLFKSNLGIILVTDNNFCVLNPDKIWRDTIKPSVNISNFSVFGNPYLSDTSIAFVKTVVLNHSQNNFSIAFQAPDFNNPEGIHFDFILENFDKSWHVQEAFNQTTYTNVPPGNYIFRVKASNNSDKWSEEKLLYIKIIPAYWQTYWFKILIILVLTATAYALYQNRINQIKKAQSLKSAYEKKVTELETIALRAQMNPHFIFNCLNSINRYILMSEPDTASSYVTKFSRLIRLILDNSRSNEVTLEQELSATRLYLEMEAMRFKNKFEYSITVQEGLDTNQIIVPPMILQPFAENAIWHGLMHKNGSGTLAIFIEVKQQQLHCVFDDDGVGRKASAILEDTSIDKKKSHGMLVTSKRLAIFNDDAKDKNNIQVIDKTDANGISTGTRVEVLLALKTISK